MRALAAIIVIILGALPGIYAGEPGLAPGFFDSSLGGVPLSVVTMCVIMVVFIFLAGWCSGLARQGDQRRSEGR